MTKACLLLSCFLMLPVLGFAQEPDPGHSHEGEAFDEGPRSFAELVPNEAGIDFAVSFCSAEAGDFINQGIGQLHGFLNYESERSFRHAAYLDPDCAMAYWGIAQASVVWARNQDRALELVAKARERLTPQHTERELLYIESIEALAQRNTSAGSAAYARKLRQIFTSNPTDLDAKAFFVAEVWQRQLYSYFGYGGSYRQRNMPLDALAREVLAVNPNHPVHHYIVHMWDTQNDYRLALTSADRIGWSGPSVAHLWHMGGHTYYRADLPFETWWQQEAGARVDHVYMEKMRVFPYMLHNHAHNNEWLSRTLMNLGNFDKAWQLAGNLLAQGKHPTFNRIDQYQHLQTGAERTINLIERGGYWELGASLFASPFLDCAQFSQHARSYNDCRRVAALTEIFTNTDLGINVSALPEASQAEVQAVSDLVNGRGRSNAWRRLSRLSTLNSGWGLVRLVQYGMLVPNNRELAAKARTLANSDDNNMMYQLIAAQGLAKAGDRAGAERAFAQAQIYSQEVDLNAPVIRNATRDLRSAGLAIADDWRREFSDWRDTYQPRPDLESFGPLLWQVPKLQNFSWVDKFGETHDFEERTEGRPAVLIFILNGCPACDVQWLNFQQRRQEFADRGVELLAVTSQPENMDAYRAVGAYDEFEGFPLHGLLIINENRDIVWQDTGALPFEDIDFVLSEVDRGLHPFQTQLMHGQVQNL